MECLVFDDLVCSLTTRWALSELKDIERDVFEGKYSYECWKTAFMKTFLADIQAELVSLAGNAIGHLGLMLSVAIIAVEQGREMSAWGICHDSHSLFSFELHRQSRWTTWVTLWRYVFGSVDQWLLGNLFWCFDWSKWLKHLLAYSLLFLDYFLASKPLCKYGQRCLKKWGKREDPVQPLHMKS